MSLSPVVASIAASPVSFLDAGAPDADVVLSCRIAFMRNLTGLPFPVNAPKSIRQKVANLVQDELKRLMEEGVCPLYRKIPLSEIGMEDREIL